MGIKRCPSFSKRPGFPCGLRVLLVDGDIVACAKAESLLKDCSYTVTTCSTAAEALNRLTSGCNSYDVLLADKSMVSCMTHHGQQLLDCSKALPCILMAQDPSPEDIMAGIQLGAVDFLAKPLSPLKLQNIWQHTVRKMMGNMNINCSADASQLSAPVAPVAAAAAKKELAEMEVILEEPEKEQQAAAAEAAPNSNHAAAPVKSAAVVDIAANMALATASSLYEPTKCISRTSSSAATETSFTLASPGSPVKGPAGGANKLQKSRHAPVHSCPSTRSLNSMSSMSSSYSTLQLAVPPTPGSPAPSDCADASQDKDATPTTAAPASSPSPAPAQQQHQQRSIKKAVRHTPATPASKPPLASKPQAAAATVAAAQNGSTSAQQAPSAGPMGPGCGATAAGPLPMAMGLTSVPLPTGLGPLPQGMVWGMPMCPLARAPGIVPPNNGSSGSQAAVGSAMMPPMSAWGMCGMPMGMPMGMPGVAGAPFMSGMMLPPMPMAMPFGAYGTSGMASGFGMPGSSGYDTSAQQHLAASGMAVQDAAAAAAAPVAVLPVAPQLQKQQQGAADAPTGAAMAAALNASLGGLEGAPDNSAAAAATLDVGDAFDFMLGDIAAEDDLDVDMSGLLDGELTALEKDGLKLPAELQELQALEQQQQQYQQQQQQQQRASFECSNRLSFDCHGRQRVSFDCSTASTTTGARVSFECSAASRAGLSSQRVSFEVSCNSAAKRASMAAPVAGNTGCGNGSDALLGSMSDLFAAGCGDSCSEGSGGMTHVDSCGMLADLQSLFAADGCAGTKDDGCSGAAGSASLFDDVMDDLPLELALKKSSSLAELLNAGLNPMQV